MAKQLHLAKKQKNDEFYTQYADIEKEMNAYYEYDKDAFRGKTVLCPCDDPEWSNFTRYFIASFDKLGLKKLISTSYAKSSGNETTSEFEKSSSSYDASKHDTHGKVFTVTKKDIKKVDFDDIHFEYLEGDGDFRSDEVRALYDEADIVVTNPPFSLFRDFIKWLRDGNKQFIIIGNLNAINDKDVFPLLMNNEIWLGSSYFNGGAAYFIAPKELYDPDKMSNSKNAFIKDGKFYWRVNGVRWYTNMEHGHRHEKMNLMTMADNIKFNKKLKKKFDEEFGGIDYPKYDNYDAIEVPYCDGIPSDYDGVMGVSISFMDKYCPEQFEIIGRTGDIEWASSDKCDFFTPPTDDKIARYKSLNKTWRVQNPYMVNNEDIPQTLYNRLFIRRRKDAD